MIPKVFASNSASSKSTYNSQRLGLLSVQAGPLTYRYGQGGPSFDIVDESALSPEVASSLNTDGSITNLGSSVPERSLGQIVKHIVSPGETLSQIAEQYQVSTDTVRWANPKTAGSKYLQAGDELTILPESGVMYTVKKGDTLSGIGAKFNISSSKITESNGLASNTLSVGKKLIIPGGKPLSTPRSTARLVSGSRPSITSKSSGSYSRVWRRGQDIGYGLTSPLAYGVMTQEFGHSAFSRRSGFYKNGHQGIDFGADKGTEIYAAAAGIVTASRWMNGYGNVIFIEHYDGRQTRYGHNSKNLVKEGEKVTAGQLIGLVGSTGRSTGNHLHFEVRDPDGTQAITHFYNLYR